MLNITDLKVGARLSLENDPWVVLSYAHSKTGRGGAVVKTKLRNLRNGNVIDRTFQGADKVDEADLAKKKAIYLYSDDQNAFFMDQQSYEQFEIPAEKVGHNRNFMIENSDVDLLYFDDQPINIELPIKMTFRVISAPPGVKGNSAGSVTKKVTLETGAVIDAPLFIKENDKVVVDTRDGSYIERASS